MAPAVEVDDNVLIKFAQKLAGNEKKFRDRALKKLRKWLGSRPKGAFTEEDMMKIWKGLHYCMWMSDKPLVQEELAESLACLISCFTDPDQALLFIKVFYATEAREWSGIDRLRLDKFMMLIRRVTRQSLVFLKKLEWDEDYLTRVIDTFNDTVNAEMFSIPDGLRFHLADIYIEEIERISEGELSGEHFLAFLQPYVTFLSQSKNKPLFQHVLKRIFFRLIDYAYGNEEEDDEEAEEEDEDGEISFKERSDAKDSITPMEIDYGRLADQLFEKASDKDCYAKNRKDIYSLVKSFRDLAAGNLPEEREITVNLDEDLYNIESAVNRLQNFEEKQLVDSCRNRYQDVDNTDKKKKKKKKKSPDEFHEDEPPKKRKRGDNSLDEETILDNSELTLPKDKKAKKVKVQLSDQIKAAKTKGVTGKKKAKQLENGILPHVNGDIDLEDETLSVSIQKKDSTKKGKKRKLEAATELTNNKVKTKGEKKKKKKKSKDQVENLETAQSSEIVSAGSGKKSAFSILNKVKNVEDETPKVKKTKKAKKQAKLNSENDTEVTSHASESEIDTSAIPVNTSVKKLKKKNSAKKQRAAAEAELADGELEIFIPNKKYKGPLKSSFHTQMMKSLEDSDVKPAAAARTPEKAFAVFENVKTPVAFVKKAMLKITPKTDPKKVKLKESLTAPSSEPGKKRRVSFIMSRNVAQEFKDSLNVSPVVPYNPLLKPEKGLLKSPATPNVLSPSIVVKQRRRSTASDYF